MEDAWEKTYVFNSIGTFVNLFGGDYYDGSNPKTQEAVKFMYDMMKKKRHLFSAGRSVRSNDAEIF